MREEEEKQETIVCQTGGGGSQHKEQLHLICSVQTECYSSAGIAGTHSLNASLLYVPIC